MTPWNKRWLADERFESAAFVDVNLDGVIDLVSGGYWYQGPDFRQKRPIAEVGKVGEYLDDFATIPLDITGNGYPDLVTGSWWGPLRWRENPGAADGDWREHIIAETGPIETVRAWDLDGDGNVDVVPNCPTAGDVRIYRLAGSGVFEEVVIFTFEPGRVQGHGLGCGDIAGNGRADLVFSSGWLEAPLDPWGEQWTWHPDFDLGVASVPILVHDFDGDGVNELIVGQAHGYGLDRWVRTADRREWRRERIDSWSSQYHEMQLVDVDGDGVPEIVTGKRHHAHNGGDPGEWDDGGIYWFDWEGNSFSKQVLDYGPLGGGASTGLQFGVHNSGTRVSFAMPGKDGLYLYWRDLAVDRDRA